MLRTMIKRVEPGSEGGPSQDSWLVDRISKANEILAVELARVTKEFELLAVWEVFPQPVDRHVAALAFQLDGDSVDGGRFTREDLADEESTRRSLRWPLIQLGRFLSDRATERMENTLMRLRQDLETLAAIGEE